LTAQGPLRETAHVPSRSAVAALAAALLAFAAPAASAAPPTLTGEQFYSYGSPSAPFPLPTTYGCTDNPDGTADVSWRLASQPTTSGPYDGTFSERGQMHVGPPVAQDNPYRDVLSLGAEFTIESSAGQVSGTKRLTAPVADSAVVLCSSNEFIVDTTGSSLALAYSATITTPQGVFADRGRATHSFQDMGPNPAAFTELRESFTSSLQASEQQHSVLFGKRTPGASWSAMSANTKRASPFTLYFPATVRRVHAYIDGNGATTGSQVVRAVLYRRDPATGGPGAFVTRSFEFNVPAGMSARWVQFYLAPPAQLQSGVYWLGLQSAGQHGVARYAWDSVPNSRRYNVDADADGPSDPFGASFSDDQQLSIFAFGSY
jgi:hypothetical protein